MLDSEFNKIGIKNPLKILHNPTYEELYIEETLPNLLLVPLLAYDVFGNRIGYGGGFYDKTLQYLHSKNNKIISIGVAFKFQECNYIPSEKHDIKLNAILNEDGLKLIKNK